MEKISDKAQIFWQILPLFWYPTNLFNKWYPLYMTLRVGGRGSLFENEIASEIIVLTIPYIRE